MMMVKKVEAIVVLSVYGLLGLGVVLAVGLVFGANLLAEKKGLKLTKLSHVVVCTFALFVFLGYESCLLNILRAIVL